MIRTLLVLVQIPLFAAVALSTAHGAGHNLSPAQYKPLPVGTVLDYGSWTCTVRRSTDFEHVCRGPNGETAQFYGKMIAFGPVPLSGYGTGFAQVYCDTNVHEIESIQLLSPAREALRSLWPLSVGKKATFERDLRSGEILGPQLSNIQVSGVRRVSVAGTEERVYVIEGETRNLECRIGNQSNTLSFKEVWWYAPDIATIVHYEIKWPDSPDWGQSFSYDLKSIKLPGNPAVARVRGAARPLLSASRNATVDTFPPVIELPETLQADGATVEIVGRARDESRLIEISISGRPIIFKSDGSFRIRRGVGVGSTVLKISALDEWGNRATREVTVTRRITTASRGGAKKPRAAAIPDLYYGKYHALVIGNNRYADMPDLETALNDARQVAQTLAYDYGFDTRLLLDATRRDILKAMAGYRRSLGANDNLLIYYAGHGIIDDVVKEGYWLPVDAAKDEPSNWISNADVTNMLRAIRAKHIMVIADSCYSGTLVRSVPKIATASQGRDKWLQRMVAKRSRTALVSGGLEPVMDGGGDGHSVFTRAFLQALENNQGVIEGQAMFDAIKRPVVLNADQTPQYSDIRKAGHEGGDFLFVRTGT